MADTDPLERKDEFGKCVKDYQKISMSLNDDARKFMRRRVRDLTDDALLNLGDVKSYADTLDTVQRVLDSVLLHLVAEGYVALRAKAKCSDETRDKAIEEWTAHFRTAMKQQSQQAALFGNASDVASQLPVGQYL